MTSDMPKDRAPFASAVYLTGPTGVGKTEISLKLADKLGAEILALDAMTLYRGMDIGTAKPTQLQRLQTHHHLIDLWSPTEASSLERYRAAAEAVLNNLASRGKAALFVGGSPLYLKACLRGLSVLPDRQEIIRARLEHDAQVQGVTSLHRRLESIDPDSAAKIASFDLRRLVRALEIYEATGTPPSRLRKDHEHPAPSTVPVIALTRNRAALYERIDRRVELMFDQGLLEEAAGLPRPLSQTAMQAVGYAEAFDVLEGRATRNEAVARTQLRTRHYAKQQLTWFRRLEEVRGLAIDEMTDDEVVNVLVERIAAIRRGEKVPSDPFG